MDINVCLAATYHDPLGRLDAQIERNLPRLASLFNGIAVRTTQMTSQEVLSRLEAAEIRILQETVDQSIDGPKIGRARREVIQLALGFNTPIILYSDFDRLLHWAEFHPQELVGCLPRLIEKDFTILGRTDRAFASHPHVQKDTEVIVNQVFGMVMGHHWDVMAGARGISRMAAQTILKGCHDDEISVDVTWPLFLKSVGGFSIGYIATEGMEFETQDRYPEEVAAAGGYHAWNQQMDSDIDTWLHRLDYTCGNLAAMRSFTSAEKPPKIPGCCTDT